MSALQNAIDLRFAVGDLVGNRFISDVFPRLVGLAEADMNAKLRTRHQRAATTLSFEGGEALLPPDFIELIEIKGALSGRYDVIGSMISMPSEEGEREITYYAAIPTLTCSPAATNWLLQHHPAAYLYGVGVEAAKYLRDADLMQAISVLYGDALRQVILADERARWAAAAVRVGGLTP